MRLCPAVLFHTRYINTDIKCILEKHKRKITKITKMLLYAQILCSIAFIVIDLFAAVRSDCSGNCCMVNPDCKPSGDNAIFCDGRNVVMAFPMLIDQTNNSCSEFPQGVSIYIRNYQFQKVPSSAIQINSGDGFVDLNIEYNARLSSIDPCAFQGIQGSINEISLKSNGLQEFPVDSLIGLRYAETAFIDLSNNHIKDSKNIPTLFNGLKHLNGVDLSNNEISRIFTNSFLDINFNYPWSSKIDLKANQIQTLEIGSFANLFNLRTLDLSYNNIVDIAEYAFINVDVDNLDLSNNKIETITSEIFQNVTVGELDLSENVIVNVPSGFLSKLQKGDGCHTINLSKNKMAAQTRCSRNQKLFNQTSILANKS